MFSSVPSMGYCSLERGQIICSSLAALVENDLLVMDPHGNLTLCGLFIVRLLFVAVLAALLGCLTEDKRAEPPFLMLTPVFPRSSKHWVTWRGSSSCLMRLCEESSGSNTAVPGGQ